MEKEKKKERRGDLKQRKSNATLTEAFEQSERRRQARELAMQTVREYPVYTLFYCIHKQLREKKRKWKKTTVNLPSHQKTISMLIAGS